MSWGFHFISRAGSFEMMAAEREQSGKKEKLRSSVYYYSYDGSQLQRLLTIYKQLWTPPRLLLILHWKPSCKNRKVQSKFQQRVASQIRLLGGKSLEVVSPVTASQNGDQRDHCTARGHGRRSCFEFRR